MKSEIQQHEVQRRLGRCMLRLQQYERLLKAMVGGIAIAGPLEQLQALREQQTVRMRKKTLGELVGIFTGKHLVAESAEVKAEADDDAGRSQAMAWASMSFNISMAPEVHAHIKADLAELVQLRNDLVHHFIERFDLSSEDSCRAASAYLDACYERIDCDCQRLRAWATRLGEAQAKLAKFVHSDEFEKAFVHGIDYNN
jgi:hypothetical protein